MKGEKYSETKARTSRINYDIKKGLSRELALERERMRSEGKKPPRFVVSPQKILSRHPRARVRSRKRRGRSIARG